MVSLVAGSDGNTCRTIQPTLGLLNGLVLVSGCPEDLRQRGGSHFESDEIGHEVRRERNLRRVVCFGRVAFLDLLSDHLQVLEVGIRRSLEFEVEFIDFGDCVAGCGDRDEVCAAIDSGRCGVDDGLFAVRVCRNRLDGRHGGGRCRQGYLIDSLCGRESGQRSAVDKDVLQSVVRQGGHTEGEIIGSRRCTVGSCYRDGRRACRRSGLVNLDCLLVLLSLSIHYGRCCSAVRQVNGVVVFSRAEAVKRRAVDGNPRQFGIGAGGTLELDTVSGGRFAIFGFDRNHRRLALQVAILDGNLGAAKGTSREGGRGSLSVGQCAGTAHRFNSRNCRGSLAQRIGLNIRSIRVEAFPFLAVHIEFLYLGRINQLYVIHVKRVTGIKTAVGTEVRIVGRREDDIHRGRHGVVHIVNRHADIGPVAVCLLLTPHTLAYLRDLGGSTALIAVERETDVGLLVVAGS